MDAKTLKEACLNCVKEANKAILAELRKLGHSQMKIVKIRLVSSDEGSAYIRVVWDRPAYMSFAEAADLLESMTIEAAAAISKKSNGRGLRYRSSLKPGYLVEFANNIVLSIKEEGAFMDFVMTTGE